jgi:gliding motility-associated-like protein
LNKLFYILIFLFVSNSVFAKHIAGGELYYEYKGVGTAANSSKYKITLRLFRDCHSEGPKLENEDVNIGVYEKDKILSNVSLNLKLDGNVIKIEKNISATPCIVGNVEVCYEVAYFTGEIELPNNLSGYVLMNTNCCRIDDILNLMPPASGPGIGYTHITIIPGSRSLPLGNNSCPVFNVKDTTLICEAKNFKLDFGATDKDNDSLVYSFCNGYNGERLTAGFATDLILRPLTYKLGFTGTTPLGSFVKINSATGVISGTAPQSGQYVVSVCVAEYRNGKIIGSHPKDFNLKVQACDIIGAELPDSIINCKNKSIFFENYSLSNNINSYLWDFGDKKITTDTSSSPTYTYTYNDTGLYIATLTINGPNGCTAKDSFPVRVYPIFKANFDVVGSCFASPFYFYDKTIASYGFIKKWNWLFNDAANSPRDIAIINNPVYSYSGIQTTKARLIVQSNLGCIDTLEKPIIVNSKPYFKLPFKDTLICSIDSLQLLVVSQSDTVKWSPNLFINDTTIKNPIVYPKDTITYTLTVNNGVCIASESLKINVLQFIKVDAGTDSSICASDTIQLRPTSYALGYKWTPNIDINNVNIKSPIVYPLANTKYYVYANLGKCQAFDSVTILVFPRPIVNAGLGTSMCFGNKFTLNGFSNSPNYYWLPTNSLLNSNTLSPTAGPSKTTVYSINAKFDTGCTKLFSSYVTVNVINPTQVFAGNDTSIALNQPMQLQAFSPDANVSYSWSSMPSNGAISNPNISNPTILFTNNAAPDEVVYKVIATIKPENCTTQDFIKVKIYKSPADIILPSAFTPNNDNKNDIFKPISIGISTIKYFNIYNRLGQLIFTTSQINKGWDGYFNSIAQPSGTYIFEILATDFTGKSIAKKGTVVLIR